MMSNKLEQVRIDYVKRKRNDLDYNLEEVLSRFKNIQVSWSGGKCSTVALHLIRQIKPDIQVFYVNTGVAYPETVKYVLQMAKEWHLNFRMIKPHTTFWKIIAKHGLPKRRHMGCEKAMKGEPPVPVCCKLLKEKPLKYFLKIYHVDLNITGLRCAESRVRMFNIAQRGLLYYTKAYATTTFHPIALWTYQQVADYIQEHNIPLNPVYAKGLKREGCWCCTAFRGWQQSLMLYNPRMYKFMMKLAGNPTMDEYIEDFEPVTPM